MTSQLNYSKLLTHPLCCPRIYWSLGCVGGEDKEGERRKKDLSLGAHCYVKLAGVALTPPSHTQSCAGSSCLLLPGC